MKKILFCLLEFTLFFQIFSQDIIYKNDGSEIQSNVAEITVDAIKYKNFDQPNGPIRNILIKDVFMIIYKDGTKEVFQAQMKNVNQETNKSDPDKETKMIIKPSYEKESNNVLQDLRDGTTYKVVQIGDQVWMAENLKATTFNDGTPIPLVIADWTRHQMPAYCWYNNDEATYKNSNGALYNWYTVNINRLCPIGWHVPTDEDWQKLFDSFGGKGVAGRQMKEVKGFNAIPAGYNSSGSFHDLDYIGSWWSATDGHFFFIMKPYKGVFDKSLGAKRSDGRSVRCVKD